MSTYPGMTLKGEVRESVSLDEDDLSDVEDEVFIRDGKHGYKFAEEVGVKRPLMAPRRKVARPDLTTRLKNKPPCRAFCKPCCYVFGALTVLIGLIVLVVILVSMFPLPLDKLRNWIVNKTIVRDKAIRLLPCSDLVVTDVWKVNLPLLTSESPIRMLDVNQDGIDDAIFGFGTGDNGILEGDIFCPVFLGKTFPCDGGVMALNGLNGELLWRHWMNDTIFSLMCKQDVNGDGSEDCLAVGNRGSITMIDSSNGSVIWQINSTPSDIYMANFIPDQDNDTFCDVLTSHSSYEDAVGHLILISGRTGKEIRRLLTPRTFFMPQLITRDNESYVIYGTGGPISAGDLNIVKLQNLVAGNLTATSLYEDKNRGMLTQSILADITGDNQLDIVTAMFNSTVVAVDGKTLRQLWNFTVPNTASLFVPVPAYFNGDNVTDFLVMYKKGYDVNDSGLTQGYVIDGKTGKPFYDKPIQGGVQSQTGGLTLMMEGKGMDMFVFWSKECLGDPSANKTNATEPCADMDAPYVMKLSALNRFDQPPGFEIYNSGKRMSFEYNNTKSPLEQAVDFFQTHPEHRITAYPSSNFRNKDNRNGLIKDFARRGPNNQQPKYEYEQPGEDIDTMGDPNEPIDMDYAYDLGGYPPNRNMFVDDDVGKFSNRDPRSKEDNVYEEYTTTAETTTSQPHKQKSKKKALSEAPAYGIYDYKNIYNARNRLLHDLNNLPSDILRDTYFKNRERQLRKSRFEQRDVKSHRDRMKENEDVKKVIEKEKMEATNTSESLWDLESEKEMQDKENGYFRGKRAVNYTTTANVRVTSMGALTRSFNNSDNTIDVIFLTYWTSAYSERQSVENIVDECVKKKQDETPQSGLQTLDKQFKKECTEEYEIYKRDFPYFKLIPQLRLGQMTVYRLRLKCMCRGLAKDERCAKFLPINKQRWSSYLGKLENGTF